MSDRTQAPLSLSFNCEVATGMGMYSELEFPAHKLWPKDMQAGSLNAAIMPDGFPEALDELGSGWGVQKLDTKRFTPLFNIAQQDIGNNSLGPRNGESERGIAQIWACEITVPNSSIQFNAWAVRRIGSAYSDVIEIMSNQHLRDTHGLQDGTPITVKLFQGDDNAIQQNDTAKSSSWLNKIKNILG